MKIRKILLGFDGSPSSYKAFVEVIDLAISLKAAITVLTVVQLPDFSPIFDEIDESLGQARKQFEIEFNKLKAKGKEQSLEISCVLLTGNPAETMIRYAYEGNFDLIVVGTRGLGRLKQLLIGSVAQKVVTCANTPVLVIRDTN
ncbi:MAG: universal stress protein [Desulfitobacterium hafniense]|nr:universal stress protein [Desulfitobacterium hafniense]